MQAEFKAKRVALKNKANCWVDKCIRKCGDKFHG